MTIWFKAKYNLSMDMENVIDILSGYAAGANRENIESVMQNIQSLLDRIPEKDFFPVAETINEIVKPLNEIYLEKMKETGRVRTLYIEDLFGPCMN